MSDQEKATAIYLDDEPVQDNGAVALRFMKLDLAIDGKTIIASQPHRAMAVPGADVDQLLDQVSADIVKLGYPAISDQDRQTVKDLTAKAWTTEVLAAFKIEASKPASLPGAG